VHPYEPASRDVSARSVACLSQSSNLVRGRQSGPTDKCIVTCAITNVNVQGKKCLFVFHYLNGSEIQVRTHFLRSCVMLYMTVRVRVCTSIECRTAWSCSSFRNSEWLSLVCDRASFSIRIICAIRTCLSSAKAFRSVPSVFINCSANTFQCDASCVPTLSQLSILYASFRSQLGTRKSTPPATATAPNAIAIMSGAWTNAM
jgi:hypothetical protein